MVIKTKVENGKAYLQFEFPSEYGETGESAVFLQVKDREGREVLNCLYHLSEEEPAQGILLHPHLWNGLEEPYLYRAEAHFVNEDGRIVESIRESFALYTLEEIFGKGFFLNGRPFELRVVHWDAIGANVLEFLELLGRMGANAVYLPDEQKADGGKLLQLFTEKGFLVFTEEWDSSMPACSELICSQSPSLTDIYYRYKALWSKEPFVHICMSSIAKQENSSFSMTVYSNQKKIALYVDGVLFEFRNGGQEYLFEEIPIKKYPAVVTAEAGECNTAVTIYENSQNFHNCVTFS